MYFFVRTKRRTRDIKAPSQLAILLFGRDNNDSLSPFPVFTCIRHKAPGPQLGLPLSVPGSPRGD